MGGELMGLKDALHRSQTHARRLRQHPAGPMAGFSRRRRERQIDHPLHRGPRQRRLAAFARLVAREPSTPSAMKRACQRHTTGLALPDRRMISDVPQPSAVARMILARKDWIEAEPVRPLHQDHARYAAYGVPHSMRDDPLTLGQYSGLTALLDGYHRAVRFWRIRRPAARLQVYVPV